MQRESGRNASNPGWQILRNSRSITHGTVILVYISREGVSESILEALLSTPAQRN